MEIPIFTSLGAMRSASSILCSYPRLSSISTFF